MMVKIMKVTQTNGCLRCSLQKSFQSPVRLHRVRLRVIPRHRLKELSPIRFSSSLRNIIFYVAALFSKGISFFISLKAFFWFKLHPKQSILAITPFYFPLKLRGGRVVTFKLGETNRFRIPLCKWEFSGIFPAFKSPRPLL
jgi:hypothetical protein